MRPTRVAAAIVAAAAVAVAAVALTDTRLDRATCRTIAAGFASMETAVEGPTVEP